MENKILVLDIETTGFLPQGGSIVEIGIVELDLNNGDIEILFDSLCYEPDKITSKHRKYLKLHEANKPIPNGTMGWIFVNSIPKITPKSVKESPVLEDLKEEIQNILDSNEIGVTAFNKSFDFDFLRSRGIEIKKELPCPMRLLAPIMNLPYPNRKGLGKWPNVSEARSWCFPEESEYVEAHRGALDAKDEAEIVFDLYKRKIFKID